MNSGAKLAGGLLISPLIIVLLIILTLGGGSTANADNTGISTEVPEAYRDLVIKAAAHCDELTPAALAAQIAAESGWNPTAGSPAGAQGIAQFMPGTWASNGVDGDNDGKADVMNPADAIPAMGKFMCSLISRSKQLIADSRIKGDVYELALAMYNAGEGNVTKYGGIPPFSETINYIARIKDTTAQYAGSNDGQTRPVSSNAIVKEASKYLGVPYVWGGKTASGLDCSGLVSISLTALGYPEVHGTDAQIRTLGKHIYTGLGYNAPWDKMKPGDLIGIDYTGQNTQWEYEHIAIYLGNKQIIHAPRPGLHVKIEDLEWTYKDRWTVKRVSE